ncbi:MAG: hypothetical protein ABSG10_11625 [Terracidiphilus sp.]|jgi:hypothetical protein
MATDEPENQFDGELAALQHQQEMESLNTSPVSIALSKVADCTSQLGIPVVGLFAKALKSGQTPVEKVVEQLQSGAYVEIVRIGKQLEGQDARLTEFETRLQSQEAQNAYLGAVLHGLRTSDPKKQSRLGALTINCVYTADLEPDDLDQTMRTTVELKNTDIVILGNLYKWQNHILNEKGMNPTKWFGDIQQAHKQLIDSGVLNPQDHLRYRSSY